ncbi:MAG: hypothetical protein HDS69_10130 [Bacteroidales bacterium]|nr:hypothetical protein [Bacteroidales bacterium]
MNKQQYGVIAGANSCDPVDISVWLLACRFRSTAEKEFRRLDSRTPKLYLPAIKFLRRLAQRQVDFLRRVSQNRFSALRAKKSATAASSKLTTLKYSFDTALKIRTFAAWK